MPFYIVFSFRRVTRASPITPSATSVKCQMSNIKRKCQMSNVKYQMSNVKWKMSNVKYQRKKCQMSDVKCQMSNVHKVKPFVGVYLQSFSGHFFNWYQSGSTRFWDEKRRDSCSSCSYIYLDLLGRCPKQHHADPGRGYKEGNCPHPDSRWQSLFLKKMAIYASYVGMLEIVLSSKL